MDNTAPGQVSPDPTVIKNVQDNSPKASVLRFVPILIVGFVMLLVGLAVGYLAFGQKNIETSKPVAEIKSTPIPTQPDSSESSNMKTYIGSGYTIQYPDILLPQSSTDKDVIGVFTFPRGPESLSPTPEFAGEIYRPTMIYVREIDNGMGVTLDSYVKLNGPTTEFTPLKIGGENGLYYPNSPGVLSGAAAYVLHGSNIYEISLNEGNETSQVGDFSAQIKIFEQMLPTLKFTN